MKKTLLISYSFLSTIIAIAQQTSSNDSLSGASDTLNKSKQLDEVVIRTLRIDPEGVGASTLLTRSSIENKYTGQEPTALLSQTPGINWYSDGGHATGYTYMRMRGIDQTRINFTLNGVPLNEPEDQGVYFSNYPDFLNSINSIQIQRGAGISTNGTASFAGSVNFESNPLTDTAYTSIQSSFGSWNSARISPEFATGLQKNNTAFYGRFSAARTDGYRIRSGNRGESFFFGGGHFGTRSVFKVTGFIGRMRSEMSWLAVPEQILESNPRANINTRGEKDSFSQQLIMAQYTHQLKSKGTLHFTGYYSGINGGYIVYYPLNYYEIGVSSSMYGAFATYTVERGKYGLRTGIHSSYYFRDHYMKNVPDFWGDFYRNRGIKTEFSAFVRGERETDKWLMYADIQLRSTVFSFNSDYRTGGSLNPILWTFLNPKIGVEKKWGEELRAYIFAGFVSREPTRNDLFAGADNPDTSRINFLNTRSTVYPESVLDIEGGIKIKKRKIYAALNFYWMQFNNEIAAIGQLSNIGLQLRENVSSSYRRGIELELKASPVNKLEWILTAAVSQNRIAEFRLTDTTSLFNITPVLVPAALGYSRLTYQLHKKVQIEVNSQGQLKSYLTNSNEEKFTTPMFCLLGASARIKLHKCLQINFMINNILNTSYYTSGYVTVEERELYPMAGRNYFLTFTCTF